MSSSAIRYIILLAVVTEILCHAILPLNYGFHDATWPYIISGLIVSIAPIFLIHQRKNSTTQEKIVYPKLSFFFIILTLILLVQHYAENLLHITPLDYRAADMLPVIQVMTERFCEGQEVYAVIPEIWSGMQPIYLPGMWLPFVPAHLGGFDMRWITTGLMIASTIIIIFLIFQSRCQRLTLAFVFPTLLLLWLSVLLKDTNLIGLAEEGVVIFYYSLLGYGLLKDKRWLISMSIALCLLSRYALAPWSILFIVLYYFHSSKKGAMTILGMTTATVILLLTISQSWSQIPMYLNLPDQYLESILADQDKYSPTIQHSLGIAKFFVYEQLGNLHFLMKACAVIIPIVGFGLYPFIKKRVPFSFYSLCLLKLSLVAFYNLLILPYPYLFYTSTFLSIILLTQIFPNNFIGKGAIVSDVFGEDLLLKQKNLSN